MREYRLKPLDDRIVVKPMDAKEVTPGGIVLPDSAQEKPTRGTVIAVGPGKLLNSGRRSKPFVETGHVVIYNRYSGSEIELDGNEVKIICESDILAVVEQ